MKEAQGIVERVIEKNGAFLVALPCYSGLLKLPAGNDALRQKLVDSKDKQQPITVVHDADFVIHDIK